MLRTLWLPFVLLSSFAPAQNQNPFAPPRAKLQYAPDRTCDLLDVAVDIDVDYANKTFKGTTVNKLAPLRNGLTEVVLHAGKDLTLSSISVNGQTAQYKRVDLELHIQVPKTVKGKLLDIKIVYSQSNSKGTGFGSGGGGWHWIQANNANPYHVGFWTQGESGYNSEWAPTWDYPNDLATSETRCTVQADWNVVGNGVLVSEKASADKKRKTYVWKMSQPHATYLLSLCGGPFDIKKDAWEGVDLWYVVPKGQGYLIDDSFGHTKDMLSYFSKTFGVKYAWPKYAQNAMYDFGGGMENVSATTLGEGGLTEARDGYYAADSINSHELGHQWFGDLVTCKDWGDTWLNESFATLLQFLYFEHSRGNAAYQWEIEDATREYLVEARRYKRPISTKMYSDPDAMFDSHTYPKGGAVLHTLRRYLGDEAFFAGLKDYLTKWRHTPVESAQLRRAMTESSGINCEPFWAQWIEKPGHPVLDYSWSYADGKVSLTVKQTQSTADGTPIYDIWSKVGLIQEDGVRLEQIHLSKTEETFTIPWATRPKAVLLDPNHDFLREIPQLHWDRSELTSILVWAPNAPDRTEAMRLLLKDPTPADIKLVVAEIEKDNSVSPVFRQLNPLANLAKPELRSFWIKLLDHKDFARRASAVSALSKLPADSQTTATLRSLINDKAPIQVVVNGINALKAWDAKGNRDVFERAKTIKDRRNRIMRAAEAALKAN